MQIKKSKKENYGIITTKTDFRLDYDNNNAHCEPKINTITLGKNCFTLESFIHEINELVIHQILTNEFNYNNDKRIWLNDDFNALSHFLSPYGSSTLINECNAKYNRFGDIVLAEDFLEDKTVIEHTIKLIKESMGVDCVFKRFSENLGKAKFYLIALLRREGLTEMEIAEVLK